MLVLDRRWVNRRRPGPPALPEAVDRREAPSRMLRGGGSQGRHPLVCYDEHSRAGVTQLAECLLPKQNVAGSNPVSRSTSLPDRWIADYAVAAAPPLQYGRGTVRNRDAADRAGTSPDELRGLVELGILQPDADGSFHRRRRPARGRRPKPRGGRHPDRPPGEHAAKRSSSRLRFMDDPAYSLFTSFTSETFQELSARTGRPAAPADRRSARRPAASRRHPRAAFAMASCPS